MPSPVVHFDTDSKNIIRSDQEKHLFIASLLLSAVRGYNKRSKKASGKILSVITSCLGHSDTFYATN